MVTLSTDRLPIIAAGSATWMTSALEGVQHGLVTLVTPMRLQGSVFPGTAPWCLDVHAANILSLALAAGATYAGVYYGRQAQTPQQHDGDAFEAHTLALRGKPCDNAASWRAFSSGIKEAMMQTLDATHTPIYAGATTFDWGYTLQQSLLGLAGAALFCGALALQTQHDEKAPTSADYGVAALEGLVIGSILGGGFEVS